MKTKLYIKRSISASHYLPDYDGPCKNRHGHNWLIEVWISGEVNPKTGMVCDFKDVKDIIDRYDHCVLNEVFDSGYLPPTAENFARLLWLRIVAAAKVRVWESLDCWAEVPG